MDNEIIQDEEQEIQAPEAVAEEATEYAEVPEEATQDAVDTEVSSTDAAVPAPESKKKLTQKWWFWAIILVVIIGIIAIADNSSSSSSSGSSSSSSSSSTYIPTVNPYVEIVKTTKNSTYGITYGAAFDSFFTNPRWSYFEASTGEDVVEFKGGFSYSGSPATAEIQFVLDLSAGTLQVYHLSINGEGQNQLMLAAMVQKVFESY